MSQSIDPQPTSIPKALPPPVLLLIFEHYYSPYTISVDFVFERWHICPLPGLEALLVSRQVRSLARWARRQRWDKGIILQNWTSISWKGLEKDYHGQSDDMQPLLDQSKSGWNLHPLDRLFGKLGLPAWHWILDGVKEIRDISNWVARIKTGELADWLDRALQIAPTTTLPWIEVEYKYDLYCTHVSESTPEEILDGELDQVVQAWCLRSHGASGADDGAQSIVQDALQQACVRLLKATIRWRMQQATMTEAKVKIIWKQRYKNDYFITMRSSWHDLDRYGHPKQVVVRPWDGYVILMLDITQGDEGWPLL